MVFVIRHLMSCVWNQTPGIRRLTSDVVCYQTYDFWCQTSVIWRLILLWDVWFLMSDIFYQMSDSWWCLLSDVWCHVCEIRNLVSGIWWLLCDIRRLISDVTHRLSDIWSLIYVWFLMLSVIRCLISDVRNLSDVWHLMLCLILDVTCWLYDIRRLISDVVCYQMSDVMCIKSDT